MPNSVSVVLPVFLRKPSQESRELLIRAIDSAVGQDYPGEFEILVVDDGSPIPVAKMLAQTRHATDPHIRVIRLTRNSGLVYALNRGLAAASHEYIARIDADDCWRPGKIAEQMGMFQADPDLSIVGTGMTMVHADGSPNVDLIRPGTWSGILKFFAEVGCPFPHGSIVARRSVYRLLGGYSHDPSVSHAEDFALWGTWLRFFKAAMVEEALYEYKVSASSISGLHTDKQRRASGMIQQAFIDIRSWPRIPDALHALAAILGMSVLDVGKTCFAIWKYRPTIVLPRRALQWLRVLMPDRDFASRIRNIGVNQQRVKISSDARRRAVAQQDNYTVVLSVL
jgi:glycosyltransferase involved in cell wall biosynthesis